MVTYTNYKGCGITYCNITGTTIVDYIGYILVRFEKLGEIDGIEKAKDYIDNNLKSFMC